MNGTGLYCTSAAGNCRRSAGVLATNGSAWLLLLPRSAAQRNTFGSTWGDHWHRRAALPARYSELVNRFRTQVCETSPAFGSARSALLLHQPPDQDQRRARCAAATSQRSNFSLCESVNWPVGCDAAKSRLDRRVTEIKSRSRDLCRASGLCDAARFIVLDIRLCVRVFRLHECDCILRTFGALLPR